MRKILLFTIAISILAAGCRRMPERLQRRPPVTAGVWEADSIARATPKYIPVVIVLEKQLAYTQHSIGDTTHYGKTLHVFQWDKIREGLRVVDSLQIRPRIRWAVIQNKSNRNGNPPPVSKYKMSPYETIVDEFGTEHYQSAPLFSDSSRRVPLRYLRDGSLVELTAASAEEWAAWEAWDAAKVDSMPVRRPDSLRIVAASIDGEWIVPSKFVRVLPDTATFTHAIFVDRRNQNICTIEKVDGKWLVRSMNPATTGLNSPPYMRATPLGIFVLQEKRLKMAYMIDGSPTNEIEGFAPYANRFCAGAYVHGIPMKDPTLERTDYNEFSASLGTTPRSHMCVRTATSHAKYIFDNFPVWGTVIFIIE